MATAESDCIELCLKLEVHIENDDTCCTKENFKKIYSFVESQLESLERFLHDKRQYYFIRTKKKLLYREDGQYLPVYLANYKEVSELVSCMKKHGNVQDMLSFLVEDYFRKSGLLKKCDLPNWTRVTFNLVLNPEQYQHMLSGPKIVDSTQQTPSTRLEKGADQQGRYENSSSSTDKKDDHAPLTCEQGTDTCQSVTEKVQAYETLQKSGESTETSMLKVRFVIFAEEDVKTIHISSHDIKELDNLQMKRCKYTDNLYETVVYLPLHISGYYKYTRKITHTGYFGWTSEKTKYTQQFLLMEKPVHRDILDGDALEIAAHLMDLIKNEYQRTHDFIDVCMQIQHVCSKHLLSDLVEVIELIVNNVPIERVSQIFCVFAFGELHGDLRRLHNSYQHTLSALSASLATTEVSKFPSNSYTNLVNISRKIFQLVRGESYTLCCYLDMFYHFLGSKGVSGIIEEIATGKCREMIAIDDNKHSEYVERIAGNLLKGDTPSIDQLEKLVRHLPLNLASGLYKIAVESMDPILGQRVKEGLRANAHTALDKAKRKHDMDMITSLNSSFEKLDLNLDERFRDFVERVIVQEIAYPWAAGDPKKRGSDSLIHSFLKMLDETACFKEDSSKVELVKSLALSPNPECRQLFLKVAQLTKFRVVYDNLESDTYVLWLENEMRLCREDKIKALFAKFLSLLAVGLPKNKVLEDALRQVALKDMKAMRIEELLKSTSSIEKMCDDETFLFDIYRTEVVEVLRKRWGKKPEDVLLQICTDVNDAKKLRINSRLTEDLITSVIDIYFRDQMPEEMYEMFFSQVEHANFWELLWHAEGVRRHHILQNKTFDAFQKKIKAVAISIKNREISIEVLIKIKYTDKSTQKLLKIGGLDETDIKQIPGFITEYKGVLVKACDEVSQVLSELQTFPGMDQKLDALQFVKAIIEERSKRLNAKKLSVKEIFSPRQFWGEYDFLPKLCQPLHVVIQSRVFKNLVDVEIAFETSEAGNADKELDNALLSMRFLFEDVNEDFETRNEDQVTQESEAIGIITNALSFMATKGIELYKNSWFALEDKPELVTMIEVGKMFADSDLSCEINLFEKYTSHFLQSTVKATLEQIANLDKMYEQIQVIESVLLSFGYHVLSDSDVQRALNSISNLKKQTLVDESFAVIKEDIEVVFKLVKDFDDDTNDILKEVANSTQLLDFLQSIDVDDVRNLIDAVEDISESHVQESTVSALIETKKFLHPIFKHHEDGGDVIGFLHCVQKQIKNLKDAKTFPVKVSECMNNLHNLKSLYKGVANRGEQTKDIIKSIITKGIFEFELQGNQVTVLATYKESKVKHAKYESALVDLRSRALLLLNTERQLEKSNVNQMEFRTFVNIIDLCLGIKDTLLSLHSSGHIDFLSYKEKIRKDELEEKIRYLKRCLEMWKSELLKCRQHYYLMNFINGSQIHRLYGYLEKSTSGEDVNTFLKFVHPNLSSNHLKTRYDETKMVADGFLSHIGSCLHAIYQDLPSTVYVRPVTDVEETSNALSDIVHEGKLMLLNLEENSDFVARTLMALYYNTFKCLPEPSQVMFCSGETSCDDIDLFLGRCLRSKTFYGHAPLFCVANVEQLPNELQFHLVDRLRELENVDDFRLAVICRGSKTHPFVDQLAGHSFVDQSAIQPVSDKLFSAILQQIYPQISTFTSEVAGLGKSTVISQMARKEGKSVLTVHLSGQVRRNDFVVNIKSLNVKAHHVMHLDIGSVDDPRELDTLVFELIVLSYVASGANAYCLPTATVYIEIANTINNSLRNSLPTTTAFKRIHMQWTQFNDFTASMEPFSANQIVCHYLKALGQNSLDVREIHFKGANAVKPISENECRQLLRSHLSMSSDISYSIVHTFLNVLADQLKKFSASVFFRISYISDMLGSQQGGSVRSCLIKAMVEVAREFASRSVNACRSTQTSVADDRSKATTDLATKLVNRTDSMIRWEESNHLMYVFHNQNIQTLSPMYRDKLKVPGHILKLFETQMKKDLENYDQKNQSQLQDILQRVARKDPSPIAKDKLKKMCEQYALTPDNLLKMVLIMLRIQANVPVVIMGETGCGKTSLIRYLAGICEVSFSVVNIHAGTTKQNVIQSVLFEHEQCLATPLVQRWLFLDEINTSECIGLICDIICHHICNGKLLAPNLAILGACNPYKLRTVDAINTAGLSSKVKTDDLSKLVYRVLPLPEMMVDFVWDFGSLSDSDEQRYIERMTESMLKYGFKTHTLLSEMLCISQSFVRNEEKSSCVVSLRDVNRCILLVSWFCDVLAKNKSLLLNNLKVNNEVKAIILALTHCYHSRFTDKSTRLSYRKRLVIPLTKHKLGIETATDLHAIIKNAQSDILNRMDLPPGTAKNTALKENVFMILVCILNRIPIFVVGKPGCSKSLAIQVIRSNLRGKDSKDDFFKTLPQLYCVSFQGSESSTSDGILKVFEKAEKYQESNSKDDVLSVVILDEIGLAEISRFNPLKVLHNLLEPDGKSVPNVAVVGISNWALDASKMNRAIHLSRPDMDEEELFETGKSICQSFIEQIKTSKPGLFAKELHSKMELPDMFTWDLEHIAMAYISYTKKLQFKNFHGLRDFYALVKYIAKCLSNKTVVTVETKSQAIMEGLQRNFGGLKSERQSLLNEFQTCVSSTASNWQVQALIKENIQDTIARHLMVITSGESVLGLIDQILTEAGRDKPEMIFGSQFEEDLTDDYHYRILSKIILCMEQGMVLILRDLEHIYGSLYDMLNQNYTRIGKKNNCRVALGPYSNPFCHVAESFRCIVLVEASRLNFTDPPFLNRFEKQFLSFTDILSENQACLVQKLKIWVDNISVIKGRTFSKDDIFPIYSDELLVSLVLSVSKLAKHDGNEDSILTKCKDLLMWIIKPEAILRIQHALDPHIRMLSSDIIREYFELPLHEGLEHLIKFHKYHTDSAMCQDPMYTEANMSFQTRLCMVFTNSNIHTRLPENILNLKVQTEKLGAFKSEKQLASRMQEFWNGEKNVLLIHCHAVDDQRHLTLTMTLVNKFRVENKQLSQSTTYKCVYMVLHMSSKVVQGTATLSEVPTHPLGEINFLCGWDLVTLESLIKPVYSLPQLCSHTLKGAIESMRPLNKVIKDNLFWSFSRIRYGRRSRNVESVSKVIHTIESSEHFLSVLEMKIIEYIEETTDGNSNEGWCMNIANDINALNTSATLLDALRKHIEGTIKMPLAKLIFKLEEIGALDSFFVDDKQMELRQEYWLSIFNSDAFSVVKSQDESGPESFQCTLPDFSLTMPFSRQIFMDIESTKDSFLMEVASAKAKCDIEPDKELPSEVMSELINQHKDIISTKIQLCDWMNYITQCFTDDYMRDYCNQFSYQCCYGLNRLFRIECTYWAINKKLDLSKLKEQYPLEALAVLHCTGWVHTSGIGLFLHMCSVFKDAFPSADSPIQLFTAAHPELIDQQTHVPDQLAEQRTESGYEVMASHTSKIPQPGTIDHVTSLQVAENTQNTEPLHTCVSFLCSYAIPTLENHPDISNYTQWENIFKNLVLAARSISDSSKEYQSLRLCSDIYGMAVVKNNVSIVLLHDIGKSLKENELDSTFVSATLAAILEGIRSVDHQTLYRIIRQYLISCLSLNGSTHFSFLFECLDSDTIPLNHVQMIKFPLEVRIDFATEKESEEDSEESEEDSDVLQQIIMDETFLETNVDCFFTNLDICIQSLFKRKRTIGPFEILIIDILETKFELNSEEFDSDIILACGRIFQTREERPIGLQFLTAVSYIRAVTRHLATKVNQGTDLPIFEAFFAAVLSGLENIVIGHQIFILFLKYVAADKSISSVMQFYTKLSDKHAHGEICHWANRYLRTCLEFNTLVHHNATDTLKKAYTLFETDDRAPMAFKAHLVKISVNTPAELQPLLAFTLALNEFYFPAYIRMIDDTSKSLAKPLEDVFTKSLSQEQNSFLKCVLGLNDFSDKRFLHGPETSYQEFALNSVLVSSFALALSSKYSKNTNTMLPPMTQCLLCPLEQGVRYFADVSDCSPLHTFPCVDVMCDGLYHCTCGNIMLFHKPYAKCMVCGCDVDLQTIVTVTQTGNPIASVTDNKAISNTAKEILGFLAKGQIVGSVALRFITSDEVSTLCSEVNKGPPSNCCDVLWASLHHHWANVKVMLNLEDFETGIFFHLVMRKGKELLFTRSVNLHNESERVKWELEFDHVIEAIENNLLEEISIFVRDNDTQFGFDPTSIELQLREADQASDDDLHTLFRMTRCASKADFVRQLWRKRAHYPFLQYVVENENVLKIPEHIYSIIQWHMSVVANINYNLKRNVCFEMTVNEYLNHLKDTNAKAASKKRFMNFKTSWNFLAQEHPELDMNKIDLSSKMAICLILDTDGQISKVLKWLVDIQNKLISHALLLSKVCSCLQFLLRLPEVSCCRSVPVSEVRKEDLVALDDQWLRFISEESHRGLQYGHGRRIEYDFLNIEKRLAEKLLFGKALVSFSDLPRIVFIDELYRNFLTLVEEVRDSVEQLPLPKDLEESIKRKSDENKSLSFELLNNLDMIMTLLKRTHCKPYIPLVEFVNERKSFLARGFPTHHLPSPESRLVVGHVISLHEFLEELSAERIIEGMSDEYHLELDDDAVHHLKTIKNTRKAELILKAIKRFTYRCIFMSDVSKDQALLQFLSQPSFWPSGVCQNNRIVIDGQEDDVADLFPPVVTIWHVGTVCQILADIIEKLQQGEVKIDRVITSWKSKTQQTQKKPTPKKASRKLKDV